MDLLLLCVGLWASTALHELAHFAAIRLLGGSVLAVGTGRPPLLVRVRVGGTVVYVGRRSPLSGLTIPGDIQLSPARLTFVSAAGPAANLAVAGLLAGLPLDGHGLLRWSLVLCNLWCFVVNAIPDDTLAGNDGARVRQHLGGPRAIDSRAWHGELAELYDAIGLAEEAHWYHFTLGYHFATQGLASVARAHLTALEGDDAPGAADRRALLTAWIAIAEDRYDEARLGFEELLSRTPTEDLAANARYGIAVAFGMTGPHGEPHPALATAPEAERALLANLLALGEALRADAPERVTRAAEALGGLSWWGELKLLEIHLHSGDLPRARAHAIAAQDAARALLADLPATHVPAARRDLAPLGDAVARVARALEDRGFAVRRPGPPVSLTWVSLVGVSWYACLLSFVLGMILGQHGAGAAAAGLAYGAPILGVFGLAGAWKAGGVEAIASSRSGRVGTLVLLVGMVGAWMAWFLQG